MQNRRPAGATPDSGPEGAPGSQQSAPGTGAIPPGPAEQPSGEPGGAPARSTVRYVPLSRARPAKAVRTDTTSDRILKYVLMAGTVLLVVLFGASMADSFLGGAANTSAQVSDLTPTVTSTPILPTATPIITDTPNPTTVQTQMAGTLSPYSVDPNSVTPDPDATVYVAPGYRLTYGGSAEPETTTAETGSNAVYATPSFPVVVTPVLTGPQTTPTGPGAVTTAPTTVNPTTTTVATTHLTPSTSAATTVPTTTQPASANTTTTKTTVATPLPTQTPTADKTTVPLPSIETTTATTITTTPPTVFPTTGGTTAVGNTSS